MKVKKWLLGFMTFAAMAVLCVVCAGAETYGDFEYGVLGDGTVEITNYNGSAEKVDIPAEIDGKSVTRIGDSAFKYCTSLTSVTIPDSVTSIGSYAFYFCTNLRSVTIPDNVTEIYERAFYHCTSLKSVTIPASVKYIGPEAFGYGIYDDEHTIVDGFSINYTKNTYGHYYATKYGFSSETCLVTEELDNGTLAIKGYAGVDKIFTVPSEINGKKVTEIGDSVFKDCLILTSVTIPNSVTSVGDRAFWGCANLTSITIPGSVMSIGFIAFSDCSSLKSVTIPDSVTSIGDSAFGDCTSLTAIDVTIGNKNYTSVNGVLFNKDKTELICYPAGKTDKSYIIPDSVISMGYSAFRSCVNLTRIIIPDSLTEIGINAFRGCTSLTSITIPNSVTSIGDWAFGGCTSLTSITIPNSVTEIGWSAFSGCTSLTSITIPDSVTSIDEVVFYNCKSLKTVTIPVSVKTIGKDAFGYYYDNEKKKISDFKIYCYRGTAGERYAKENSFDYILLDKLPTLSKVTGVKLGGRAADALRINWSKNASGDGYIVEMYQGNKWARVGKITNNSTTTFRKSGLKAGTAYKFRVRAYKMNGSVALYSDYSATVAARTNPSVIKGAKLTGRAADALRINWSKNASADGYIVEMYQGNKWVRVGKITNNSTTTFRKAGLKASSVYKFRVRAYKMSGKTALYSAYSTTVTARTNPSVMKGAKLGGRAADALRVNWTRNASADGYIVEMYKNGKWVRAAKITNKNTTTFRKAGLKASTVYKFRVRAYKMSGKTALYGNYSATVTARTNPSVMKGVKIGGKAKDALRVNWTKNASAQGYIVEMYKGGKWVRVAKITNSNTTTFRKAGLAKNTAYKFRVKAYYMSGKTALYGNYGSVSGKTAAK